MRGKLGVDSFLPPGMTCFLLLELLPHSQALHAQLMRPVLSHKNAVTVPFPTVHYDLHRSVANCLTVELGLTCPSPFILVRIQNNGLNYGSFILVNYCSVHLFILLTLSCFSCPLLAPLFTSKGAPTLFLGHLSKSTFSI